MVKKNKSDATIADVCQHSEVLRILMNLLRARRTVYILP